MEVDESSSSSSTESGTGDEQRPRVALNISPFMKTFLEFDYRMVNEKNKLAILPAKIPIITILENYVKYYSIKSICAPMDEGGPRRRNSAAKTEKQEKNYEKLKAR